MSTLDTNAAARVRLARARARARDRARARALALELFNRPIEFDPRSPFGIRGAEYAVAGPDPNADANLRGWFGEAGAAAARSIVSMPATAAQAVGSLVVGPETAAQIAGQMPGAQTARALAPTRPDSWANTIGGLPGAIVQGPVGIGMQGYVETLERTEGNVPAALAGGAVQGAAAMLPLNVAARAPGVTQRLVGAAATGAGTELAAQHAAEQIARMGGAAAMDVDSLKAIIAGALTAAGMQGVGEGLRGIDAGIDRMAQARVRRAGRRADEQMRRNIEAREAEAAEPLPLAEPIPRDGPLPVDQFDAFGPESIPLADPPAPRTALPLESPNAAARVRAARRRALIRLRRQASAEFRRLMGPEPARPEPARPEPARPEPAPTPELYLLRQRPEELLKDLLRRPREAPEPAPREPAPRKPRLGEGPLPIDEARALLARETTVIRPGEYPGLEQGAFDEGQAARQEVQGLEEVPRVQEVRQEAPEPGEVQRPGDQGRGGVLLADDAPYAEVRREAERLGVWAGGPRSKAALLERIRAAQTTSPAEAGPAAVPERAALEASPSPRTVGRTGEPGAVTPAESGEVRSNVPDGGEAVNPEVAELARWRLEHRSGRPNQVKRFNQEFEQRLAELAQRSGNDPATLRAQVNRAVTQLQRRRGEVQARQFEREQEHSHRVEQAMRQIDATLRAGGFELEYTSKFGSRYYRRGDETVRVSDHLVPPTPERDARAAERGYDPQWTHELVLDTPRNVLAALHDAGRIAGGQSPQPGVEPAASGAGAAAPSGAPSLRMAADEGAVRSTPEPQPQERPQRWTGPDDPALIEQIAELVSRGEHEAYGLRVLTRLTDHYTPEYIQRRFGKKALRERAVKVGDVLQPSYRWEDGETTNDVLEGTSVVWLPDARPETIRRAIARLTGQGAEPGEGGYSGNQIVLVGGERVGSGTDPGEALIRDGRVLATWTRGEGSVDRAAPAASGGAIPLGGPDDAAPARQNDVILYSLNPFQLAAEVGRLAGVVEGAANRAGEAVTRTVADRAKWAGDWLAAKLSGVKGADKVAAAARQAIEQVVPQHLLPTEAARLIRDAKVRDAYGRQRAMEYTRLLTRGGRSRLLGFEVPAKLMKDPGARREMWDYLTGRPANPPAEVRPVLDAARREIDRLGAEAVRVGLLQQETYDRNRGTWLPRLYSQKELDKLGLNGTTRKLKIQGDRFKARLSDAWAIIGPGGEPVTVPGAKTFRFPDAASRDAALDQLIIAETVKRVNTMIAGSGRRIIPSEVNNPEPWMDDTLRATVRRVRSEIAGRYHKSNPLSEAQLDQMGLVREPGFPVGKALLQLNHDVQIKGLFDAIAKRADWVSDSQTDAFSMQIPDQPRYGAMAGKWVEPAMHGELTALVEAPSAALQLYDAALRYWKKWKTVYNPATHGRNILGNVIFADFAGVNPANPANARYYAQAVQTLAGKRGTKALEDLYETGILTGDLTTQELTAALKSVGSVTVHPDRPYDWVWRIATLRDVRQLAEKAYQLEDTIFKTAAYLKQRDMGVGRDAAVEHVRRWFPFYDQVPDTKLVRNVRRYIMPFGSFYYEAMRIGGNALVHKPVTAAKWLATPALMSYASALMLGLTAEEYASIRKEMRGTVFGYPVFSVLLPWRDSDGRIQQWDLTNVIPYADVIGQRNQRDQDEPLGSEVVRKYLTANPLMNIAVGLATNENPFSGRRLVQTGMSTGEALGATGEFVRQTLQPGIVSAIERTAELGEVPRGTLQKKNPAQTLLRTWTGIDLRSAEPHPYRLIEEYKKARGLPPSPKFDDTTPASRARTALYQAVLNGDQEAFSRQIQVLEGLNIRIRSARDVMKLVEDRDPLGALPKAERGRFIRSLNPTDRASVERTVEEWKKARLRARDMLREHRRRLAGEATAPAAAPAAPSTDRTSRMDAARERASQRRQSP